MNERLVELEEPVRAAALVIVCSSAGICVMPGTRGPGPVRHRSGDGGADRGFLRTQGDNSASETVRRSQAREVARAVLPGSFQLQDRSSTASFPGLICPKAGFASIV